MQSRSLGSIAVKYGSRKPAMKASLESNSRARQTSCFQNSVEKPMTAQMPAWRRSPASTSALLA